jgi:hypothetical protein
MLLVSRFSQAGDRKFAGAARARLDRVAGSQVDPIVATKFWHSDCVSACRAPSPMRVVVNGAELRMHSAKKFVSVINDANFSSCTRVKRVSG